MTSRKKTILLYLASVLIPALLMTAALALAGAVPFGTDSIIWQDADIQYMDFFNYLRTILRGENDIFYSFSKNLGGEMLSLLAYYLLSPFNLLFGLATEETLPAVFTLVAVLKISLCGLTFFHASVRRWGCSYIHLAFSTAYALMAYNVIYCWSLMWLDGVLILPLLGLGLWQLWQGKRPWLYSISLGYGLLTNFYIGYMLCIASVLFSLVHMLLMEEKLRRKVTGFGRFVGASCIGGLGSAFLWLPAFLGLLGGRAKFDGNTTNILINFNILGLAGKLTAGSASPTQVVIGTPHIFCGMAVLFLVLLFFLNRRISGRVRLSVLGVLGILFVSFLLRPLNIIWHGFSANYAFNFRYAFLFSYVMLVTAQYSLFHAKEAPRWAVALITGMLVLLVVGLMAVRGILKLDYLSIPGCVISLFTVCVLGLLMACPGRFGRLLLPALLILSIGEMGANCALSWHNVIQSPGFGMVRTDSYREFTAQTGAAVDYVTAQDSGFYRMEKDFQHDWNDGMFFNYNGLSHFSSSQQKQVLTTMEKLGFTNYLDIWAAYQTGSTGEVDSLLGVKYLLSREDMTEAKGYTHLATVEGIGIYQNPNVLPIAFLAEQDAADLPLDNPDLFSLHNDIWRSISGQSIPVLEQGQYSVTLNNLFAVPLEDGAVRYVREDESLPASLVYQIPITREDPLYFYFTAPSQGEADILADEKNYGYYFHPTRWNITNTGPHPVGETLTIEVVLHTEQIAIGDALFYYEDPQALAQHTAAVLQQSVTLERQTSSRLRGSFTAREEQLLLFTIPMEAGWKLYVDGEETVLEPVLDSFMAARVSPGQHAFEMRFVPRGLVPGCAVSAFALLAAALWYLYDRRKKQ